jgi:hypothetical protein
VTPAIALIADRYRERVREELAADSPPADADLRLLVEERLRAMLRLDRVIPPRTSTESSRPSRTTRSGSARSSRSCAIPP